MIDVHVESLSSFLSFNNCSRYLFFTRNEPARVRCVYAFAFIGSIDGDVERITPLDAFGAMASRCALRLPDPSPSRYSPRSLASCSVSAYGRDG